MDRRRLSVFANFVGYSDKTEYDKQVANTELRRLSDGLYPVTSSRHPSSYHYYHQPNDSVDNENFMLKRKNSSFNMLLDSTSSMMRTASSTVQCLLGSARRASYCGQPDPSVQMAPNAVSGSLYLRSTVSNSDESSISYPSYDDQKRRVTIYDGRIPSAPVPPSIPFELMTPLEAITKAVDDPIESFVQIVLEKPDDKPLIMPPMPGSPPHASSTSRRRHRSSSPRFKPTNSGVPTDTENTVLPKLTLHQSMPTPDTFHSNLKYFQTLANVEPMDFSFLEPVLRGESAAPPPLSSSSSSTSPIQYPSSSLLNDQSSYRRRASPQAKAITENSTVDSHTSIRSPNPSTREVTKEDNKVSLGSSLTDNQNKNKSNCTLSRSACSSMASSSK